MLAQLSWMAIGRVFAALLQMASLGIAASLAGPADFGLLAAVLGLFVIPQSVLDFGIATYVTRSRAADINDGTVTYALGVNSRVSLILIAGAFVALGVAGSLLNPLFWSMLPLAIWVGAQRNADVLSAIALADGNAHVSTISLVGARAVIVLLQLCFLLSPVDPVTGYSVASAVGALASVVYLRRLVRPRLAPIDKDIRFAQLLGKSWPYWLHSSSTQIRNVDTALVAAIASPAAAGMYAVASRLTGPLRILPTSLAAVLLPELARRGGKLSARLRGGIVALMGGLVVFYVAVAVAAGWAVPYFLGEEYLAAVPAVQIVCVGLVFGAAASLLASVLQARGLQRPASCISLATAMYCVVAIAVGTSVWGAVGAAVGLVSSFALQATLMLAVLRFRSGGVSHRN